MHRVLYPLFSLAIIAFMLSCEANLKNDKASISAKDTINKILETNGTEFDKQVTESGNLVADDELETYYLVVVDTSLNYYHLQRKMQELSNAFKIPIDTMGRVYNKAKDLIALPEDDEDEIYRGDYFPRRFPSSNLSLEYLKFYNESSKEKTIALVAGIYESKSIADSAWNVLKKHDDKAFTLKADIYVGCMH